MTYCLNEDSQPDVVALARVVSAVEDLIDTLRKTGLQWWTPQQIGEDDHAPRAPMGSSPDERVLRWCCEALVADHEQMVDEAYNEEHHPFNEHAHDLSGVAVKAYQIEDALRVLAAAATPLDVIVGRELVRDKSRPAVIDAPLPNVTTNDRRGTDV